VCIHVHTEHTHTNTTYIYIIKNNITNITDDVITKVDAHIGFNNVCAWMVVPYRGGIYYNIYVRTQEKKK
jgi:hypothetical protein